MTAPAHPAAPDAAGPALTVADRCDACGAQAFVRAVLVAGDLLFCGHHARAYEVRLRETALLVEDGTDAINPRPSPSAY